MLDSRSFQKGHFASQQHILYSTTINTQSFNVGGFSRATVTVREFTIVILVPLRGDKKLLTSGGGTLACGPVLMRQNPIVSFVMSEGQSKKDLCLWGNL